MYQSHYSYFPYHRNIVQHDNKQGIVESDITNSDVGQDNVANRESPGNSSSHHYQTSPYSRHNGSFHQQQHPDPEYSPQQNNNVSGSYRDSPRDQQPLPPLIRAGDKVAHVVKGERDRDGVDDEQRTAQYLSANCVIFTYYTGDINKIVDDHFSKALNQSSDRDQVPLSARNLPPSFWDSNWVAPAGSLSAAGHSADLVPGHDHWSGGDPWHNYMAAQMATVTGGSYSAHQMYHNARSYSSLLLHSRREWVEQNYNSSPYTSMSGLDGGMQSGSKDLYWF